MHRLLGLHATLECHYLLTVTAPSLPNKSIKTLLKRNAACYRSGLPPDQKSGLRLPHEPPSFKLALTEHNAHLPKRKRFYLFSAEEMVNPKTGKAARWHSLCSLEEGEDRARQIAKEIQRYNTVTESGDMPHYLSEYRIALLKRREVDTPKEPVRISDVLLHLPPRRRRSE